MAQVKIHRKTKETDVKIELDVLGSGQSKITTGIGFFDHMLELFSFHACFDLQIMAKGDLRVCGHHTVEDTGIVLGQALYDSLPEKRNIVRYGSSYVPMDEALVRAVVDICGRPYLVFDSGALHPSVGTFDTELVREFFQALADNARLSLHLEVLHGLNTHHKIEAMFKATGRALRIALAVDAKRADVSSTKGVL